MTHENLNKRKPNLHSSCYLCEEQVETVNHLFLHCKWTDQLCQKRKIKWTKLGRIIKVLKCWNRDGMEMQERKRRDEGLSQLAFGGEFGRKGIKDVLKENRTISRR